MAPVASTVPDRHEPGCSHLNGSSTLFFIFLASPAKAGYGALPSTDGEDDDMAVAHALILETQRKMTRRYRDVANRKRKNQKVEVGTLVWIKNETTVPGTCRKLNIKWDGIYRVVEMVIDSSVYVVENVFTGKKKSPESS